MKKRRSAAQKAATKKMLAANKKRRGKKVAKKTRKKRRTAKQIAATRKLIALNKRRKNPPRKKTKRKTVKRKATGLSQYSIVFKCIGGKVYYFDGKTDNRGDTLWSSDKQKAARFASKKWAETIARQRVQKAPKAAHIGVANATTNVQAIKNFCAGKI